MFNTSHALETREYKVVPATSTMRDCREDTLLRRFRQQYVTLTADTAERVRLAQKIRYQVYCIEHPFLSVDSLDCIETDEFDSHSVHTLLLSRETGDALGTARLILPRPHAFEHSFAVQHVLDRNSLKTLASLPHHSTAEVSRFSISRQLRRQGSDSSGAPQSDTISANPCGPLMRLGLFRGLVHMSMIHGITHWCAVMEPTLLRMFTAMAIRPEPLGPMVEYHGLRQPCYIDLHEMLDTMMRERPAMWEVMTEAGSFMPGALRAVAA
jgi:N-acyl amino acid synthase of PEP-CTERM/exosortase system